MEPSRVELHNWPHDRGPGGWVGPHGDPIRRWVVRAVHARYVAPRVEAGARDARGRRVRPRPELHAYLVDLAGDELLGLPDYDGVLLHQVPTGWWFIKVADSEYLEQIERFKVE